MHDAQDFSSALIILYIHSRESCEKLHSLRALERL